MNKTLEVYLSGNTKELDAALARADKKLKDFGSKVEEIGKKLSIAFTAPLLAVGTASFKFASDLNESLNKVDVAFKNSAGEVRAFAKTTMTSFGIAEGTALDMAAMFGDMATSMGLSTSESAKMSKALVGLAGDIASFKNMNIEQVTTALSGIFTQETESLKRLGIVMTEQNLKQYALAKGIKTSYDEMSQSSKTMLRFQFIMDSTKNSQGDFARTNGAAANQTRMFGEGLKQAASQIGAIFLPMVTSAMKVLNGLLQEFFNLDKSTKQFIVVAGAALAAIGPLMIGFGKLTQGIISFSLAMKNSAIFLKANPYILLGTAIAGLTLYVLEAGGAFNKITTAQQTYADVQKETNRLVKDEIVQVNNLLKIARNHTIELDKRTLAIQQLNAINPEYLKGITLENVNTAEGTKILGLYNKAILDKAKNQAIAAKIQELSTRKFEIQTGEIQAGVSWYKILGAALKVTGEGLTVNERLQSLKTQANKNEIATIDQLLVQYQKIGGTGVTDEILQIGNASNMTAEEMQKMENATMTMNEKISKLKNDLIQWGFTMKEIQKDLIDFKNASIQYAPSLGKPKELDEFQKANLEILKKQAAQQGGGSITIQTPEQLMSQSISSTLKNMGLVMEQSKGEIDGWNQKIQEMQSITASAFESIGLSIMNSLGLGNTALGAFIASIGGALVKMAALSIAESMFAKKKIQTEQASAQATGIKIGTNAAAAAGPAGLLLLAPAIASAMGIISGAFASVPAFASGGIVSGPTMALMGEYPGAKSNPEVIAPLDKLQGMIGENAGNNVNVSGEFVVRGQDLVLALTRANKTYNKLT